MPCQLECETVALMEDRLLAILPLNSRFASYPRFPLVECETEPFISLLESSDHDARRALDAAGVKPNVRFYTKDDYAIIAMVEQGLGTSLMSEMMLQGFKENVTQVPLDPPAYRKLGIACRDKDRLSLAASAFMEHVKRWVAAHYPEERQVPLG
jgi:DNA-binding transcriptional LysR family regulator